VRMRWLLSILVVWTDDYTPETHVVNLKEGEPSGSTRTGGFLVSKVKKPSACRPSNRYYLWSYAWLLTILDALFWQYPFKTAV
jgi:hypothetical protein